MFVLLLGLVFSPAAVDCGVEFQIGSKGKHANLDRFDGTCGRSDLKNYMTIDSIDFDGVNLYLNYTVGIRETVPDEGLKHSIVIKRCLSKENPDSCENFYVYSSKSYCKLLLLQANNPLWSSFFMTMQPALQCPIQKAIYKGVNCKVAVGAFLMFPAVGYYWKMRLETVYEPDGRLMLCVMVETQISVKRS